MAGSAERLPILDGLRAISILLVLAGHMLPLGPKLLQLNSSAAGMGMSLFFALSGFLITSGLIRNPDVHEFLVKRLARIVPLAYAYTFLVFSFLYFDPKTMFLTDVFLANYFPDHLISYNAHFWSLCVEVHFYLAIALVVLIAGDRAIWIIWPMCLVVTALRVGEGAYYHIQTHLRVDEILAGACVAMLYRPSWRGRIPYCTGLAALAAILWFISASSYTGLCQYLRPYTTALLLATCLTHGETPLAAFLTSRSMRYLAVVSYALYIIHPVTTHGWWNEGNVYVRYLIKRPISFAMTFMAAHLSTFHWERLWLQAGRNWIQQRRMRRLSSAT